MKVAVHRMLLLFWTGMTLTCSDAIANAAERNNTTNIQVRRPLGPDELPEGLPGRWKVSLCVSVDPGHAWIRFENTDTGEVRTAGRFQVLVGGWIDPFRLKWHYGPTLRAGVYMDREQSCEEAVRKGTRILLSTYLDNPRILRGANDGRGHGIVTNNCVTYARDCWHHYTGEYYPLPEGAHTPGALRNCVLHYHPEVLTRREVD